MPHLEWGFPNCGPRYTGPGGPLVQPWVEFGEGMGGEHCEVDRDRVAAGHGSLPGPEEPSTPVVGGRGQNGGSRQGKEAGPKRLWTPEWLEGSQPFLLRTATRCDSWLSGPLEYRPHSTCMDWGLVMLLCFHLDNTLIRTVKGSSQARPEHLPLLGTGSPQAHPLFQGRGCL